MGSWFRRVVFRLREGFWPQDYWSIDVALARWILPRMRYLRDNAISYPGDLESFERWQGELDVMIATFEVIADDQRLLFTSSDGIEAGLDLFRARFFHLWD